MELNMLSRFVAATSFVLILLILIPAISMADENTEAIQWVKNTSKDLNASVRYIKTKKLKLDDIIRFIDYFNIEKPRYKLKEEYLIKRIALIKNDVEKLGKKDKNESKDVSVKRLQLLNINKQLEKARIDVSENLKTVNSQHIKLYALRKHIFANEYLGRGDNIFQLLSKIPSQAVLWSKNFNQYFTRSHKKSPITLTPVILISIILGIVFMLGLLINRLVKKAVSCDTLVSMRSEKFKILICEYNNYLPYLFILAISYFSYHLMDAQYSRPLVHIALHSLAFYFLLRPFVNSLFKVLYADTVSVQAETEIEDYESGSVQRLAGLMSYTKLLLISLILGYAVHSVVAEINLGAVAKYLVQDIFLVIVAIVVFFGVSKLLGYKKSAFRMFFRYVSLFFVFAALILEFSGYRSLSYYIFKCFIGSTLLLSIYWYVSGIITEATSAIQSADSHWHSRLNRVFRSQEKVAESGLYWLKILLKSVLWVGLIVSLVLLFGVYELLKTYVNQYFFIGIKIGSITISPYKILLAFLVFVVMQSLTGWFKKRLNDRMLKNNKIDHGAREAMVTLSGYVGFSVALVVALSIAGVAFSNLAIIAGALSVGIGFGLQNIVNNFISGLILLFERPIKTGDWVIVGDVEGYVKKISIRATIIQTFDNADVVVPNAEFISSRVTNWMYSNKRGRIKILVSVAYGTDANVMIELLTSAANLHEEVIQEDSSLPIRVLFMEFGDSALKYELRCFIKNIDSRLIVISELNQIVNKKLDEAKIKIPYPQTDVHLHKVEYTKK